MATVIGGSDIEFGVSVEIAEDYRERCILRCESSLGFESVIAIAEKYGDGVAACTVKTVGGDKVEFAIAINVGSGNALGFGARGKRSLRIESSIANTQESAGLIIEAVGCDDIGKAISVD